MSDSEAPEAPTAEANEPQPESTKETIAEEPSEDAVSNKIIEEDEAISTPAAEAADDKVEVEGTQMTEEVDQPSEEQEVHKQEDGAQPGEVVPEETAEQQASDEKQMETVKEEEGEEKSDKEKEVVPETEDADEPPIITESLSRGETPTLDLDGPPTEDDLLPRPISPEGEVIDEEHYPLLEDEIEIPQYNREELLQSYQTALNEREQLNQQNHALQHKLSEYFRKKKTEEARQEVDKNVTDQEQRYMKYMSNLDELRQQQTVEQETYNEQLEELKVKKTEKHGKVEVEWTQAIEFKKAVAVAAINSRSGRPIPGKDIELYEQFERKKEAEVSQVRLENIKLKNRLRKQELQLKQKEELAEGLHLIDFEQLKIENQTYNEKIEERNEELLKLRKKITSTVQVLTHLKEKLQFVQAENHVRKLQLGEVEQEVAQKRDILSRTKQSRDALRHDNQKLQQKCGLLGNASLLRDFETSTDEADELYHRLDVLKRTHAELTLNLNGIKRKIELAKETKR